MKRLEKGPFSRASKWRDFGSRCQPVRAPYVLCILQCRRCTYALVHLYVRPYGSYFPLGNGHRCMLAVSLSAKFLQLRRKLKHSSFQEAEGPETDLNALRCLERLGRPPATDVYLSLLSRCAKTKSLTLAKGIKANLDHHKVNVAGVLGDYLVTALAKCYALDDAHQIFLSLPLRSTSAWNAMLSGYTDCGQAHKALKMYHSMQEEGAEPNHYTFLCLSKTCASLFDLTEAEMLHADAQRNGLAANVFVGTSLLSTYGKCGSIRKAEEVFDRLCERNAISWNAMLSTYVEHGQGKKALLLYRQLREEGTTPNQQTVLITIQACGVLLEKYVATSAGAKKTKAMSLEIGIAIHCEAQRKGLASDLMVGNTLISMYGNCGSFAEANNIFDGLSNRDVVSWSAILSAHLKQNEGEKTLQLYRQMQEEGVHPDQHTYVISLQACGALVGKVFEAGQLPKVALEVGQALHADAHKKFIFLNSFVSNSLISMYGKSGSIDEAENVFNKLSDRDLVSWNAMLSAYVEQGHGEKTLLLYRQMVEEDIMSGKETFVITFQACDLLVINEEYIGPERQPTKVRPLEIGQCLHADARTKGFTLDIIVCNTLVTMYGKCGNILAAENVFNELTECDVVSWTAIQSVYIQQDKVDEALLMYKQMQEEGVSPNQQTFVTTLQACGILADTEEVKGVFELPIKLICLKIGKALHCDARREGFDSYLLVSNILMNVYGRCGSIMEMKNIFARLSCRDAISWNTMIAAYIDQGQVEEALLLFRQMHEEGGFTEKQTYVVACQTCGLLSGKRDTVSAIGWSIKCISLEIGQGLHVDALRRGFLQDMCVGNTLLDMYGKCGNVQEAESVFNQLPECDVVSWTSMLSAYVDRGQGKKALCLFRQLQAEGGSYNEQTLVITLQACCTLIEEEVLLHVEGKPIKVVALEIGKALHDDAKRKSLAADIFFCNTLISMYSKCGSIKDAETFFEDLPQRNIVSWNAMLSAFVEQGQQERTLRLYRQMQAEGLILNQLAFAIPLQACGMLVGKEEVKGIEGCCSVLEIGKALHADAWMKGFTSDVFLGYNLVSMYAKSDCLAEAERVFDGLVQHNLLLWNLMLLSYVEKLQRLKALQLYVQMLQEGFCPDQQTLAVAIQACCLLLETEKTFSQEEQSSKAFLLEIGQALHVEAKSRGFSSDVYVGNSLIGMYSRHGEITEAENVFRDMLEQDVISCNKMLSAYVEQGDVEMAFELYRKLEEEGTVIDDVTLVFALQLATETGSLELCQQLHFKVIFGGFDHIFQLANTLIRAYGSCASIVDAKIVFDGLVQPDVVSYNAFIAGLAQEGNHEACFQMLREYQSGGNTPDEVTFLSILSACSHSSVICKGVEFFEFMYRNREVISTLRHYVAMVDLLGRVGDFKRVECLLLGMPMQANFAIWLCVLGACRQHSHLTLAKEAFDLAAELKPMDASMYILMSNIYVDSGLQQHVHVHKNSYTETL